MSLETSIGRFWEAVGGAWEAACEGFWGEGPEVRGWLCVGCGVGFSVGCVGGGGKGWGGVEVGVWGGWG